MAFTLKSGNSPKFKNLGAAPAKNMKTGSYAHKFENESSDTPVYLKQFGVGEGTSPLNIIPVDNPSSSDTWADALKKDPKLNDYVKERDKHEKGSAEYEKYQAKINAAHGKVRNQKTLKKDQDNLANKEKTKEETEVSTDDDATNIKAGGGGDKASLIGKIGKGVKGVGGALFQGLTHGLDAVYGTGKVNAGGSLVLSEPKKKDTETGEQKVDKLINKEV